MLEISVRLDKNWLVFVPALSHHKIKRLIKNFAHLQKCTYCKRNNSRNFQSVGTCIQCCAGICAVSFHPTCAHAAGIKMEPGDWPLPVFVYCHRHALQKERAMVTLQINNNMFACAVHTVVTLCSAANKSQQDSSGCRNRPDRLW